MNRKWIFLFPAFLISNLSYAYSNIDVFISGGGGIAAQLHNKTSVIINDFVINNYVKDTNTVGPLAGLGIEYTFNNICINPLDQPLSIALGLATYYVNFGKVQGTEFPFVNGGNFFDTLDYQFDARSYALLLESRIFYNVNDYQPYLLGGIGTAWNTLHNYSETPTDPSSSAAPIPIVFGDNTQKSFAYEAGIGVQRQIYQDCEYQIRYFASVDYRYINFGNAQLGSFPAQTSNERLEISNLSTHDIVISLKASI